MTTQVPSILRQGQENSLYLEGKRLQISLVVRVLSRCLPAGVPATAPEICKAVDGPNCVVSSF